MGSTKTFRRAQALLLYSKFLALLPFGYIIITPIVFLCQGIVLIHMISICTHHSMYSSISSSLIGLQVLSSSFSILTIKALLHFQQRKVPTQIDSVNDRLVLAPQFGHCMANIHFPFWHKLLFSSLAQFLR